MAALVLTAALVLSGVDGSPWQPDMLPAGAARAERVATTCVSDPLWCNPPTNPFDLVPPGTHCLELLPYAMQAGITPEDFAWYGNTSWGESHCHPDAHNPILREGTWGAMQISFGSWKRLCGLSSGAALFDLETTFRCTLAVEAAAGRRQWSPHSPVTGCFPKGVGTPC